MANKMADTSTFIGIAIGVGALIVGFIYEGGNIVSLIGVSSIIIIVGGTMGAVVISYSLAEVLRLPVYIADTLKPIKKPSTDIIMTLISFSEKARRDGLLSLEDDLQNMPEGFLKKGLGMVVDGTEPEIIRDVLENEISQMEATKMDEAKIFDTAGGFSPTMGIIGTVMGLVLVLSNMGGSAEALGHSIAVAFIATLYGISLANLVWLPLGTKLKRRVKAEATLLEMYIVALMSIQAGDNPVVLQMKLECFLTPAGVKELRATLPNG